MTEARAAPQALQLRGVGVMVTRPRHQAEPLARRLEAAGARVVRFPALEIAQPADLRPALGTIERLAGAHLAVFVSANAVTRAMLLVAARGGWPRGVRAAAIGAATAAALERWGLDDVLRPAQAYDSEALLALPALQASALAGRRVVVFRGEGGRELLERTLAERGAQVESAVVYRRERPRVGARALGEARRGVDVVVVTSGEGLRNLFELTEPLGREWLRARRLVVVGERTAALARALGVRRAPVVAARADEAELVAAVVRAACAD